MKQEDTYVFQYILYQVKSVIPEQSSSELMPWGGVRRPSSVNFFL